MTFREKVTDNRHNRLRRARRFFRWIEVFKGIAGIAGGFALIWIFAAVMCG